MLHPHVRPRNERREHPQERLQPAHILYLRAGRVQSVHMPTRSRDATDVPGFCLFARPAEAAVQAQLTVDYAAPQTLAVCAPAASTPRYALHSLTVTACGLRSLLCLANRCALPCYNYTPCMCAILYLKCCEGHPHPFKLDLRICAKISQSSGAPGVVEMAR